MIKLIFHYISGLNPYWGKLNFEGSNGYPLKGEPSESHAFFNISICFSSSVVGNPYCFLYCSYMIFRIAPYVSGSKSSRGFLLSTLVVSISGSPVYLV